MLKIYLRSIEYELHDKKKVVDIGSSSNYVIKDESDAVSKTTELGAYTDEAIKTYRWASGVEQKKKGRVAYYGILFDEIYLREWKSPDAKLVMYTTYEEALCSVRELMQLPVPDVIAYLKQEGLSLIVPS